MNKTHLNILPILALFFIIFFGWSTSNAQTVEKLTQQLREVENLPSGTVFQMKLTDTDATNAAEEYLNQYMEDIQNLVQQASGMKLEFSDPLIDFDDDQMIISIRGGVSFMKVTVSARSAVFWDQDTSQLKVDVKSVDIPVISVDPATVNSYIQEPLNNFIVDLMEGYEIRSFVINDGYALLEAMKK